MDLENKNIVITGGTRGIGRSVVKNLLEHNANVVIIARTKKDLQNTIKDLESFGNIHGIQCDVTLMNDIKKMFKQIKSIFKNIDVFINNVGTTYIGPAEKMSLSDWNQIINTNLTSVFLCCKEIIPLMKKQQSGHIINIISNSGKNGAANFSAYCASKFGELGFSQSLFHELRPFGIHVTSICPGGVDTDMWKNVIDDPLLKPKKEKSLQTKDVADVVNFILIHDNILFMEPIFVPSSLYY